MHLQFPQHHARLESQDRRLGASSPIIKRVTLRAREDITSQDYDRSRNPFDRTVSAFTVSIQRKKDDRYVFDLLCKKEMFLGNFSGEFR